MKTKLDLVRRWVEWVRDWRGNEYPLHEPIGRDCEYSTDDARHKREVRCKKSAVRHVCKAENFESHTHWHGMIHTEQYGLAAFCLEHGEHLRATDSKQTQYDNVAYTRRHW